MKRMAVLFVLLSGGMCVIPPVCSANNVFKNGDLEIDVNGDLRPDSWGVTSAMNVFVGYTASWVDDPSGKNGKVLKTTFDGSAQPQNQRALWYQDVPVDADTWYEFSVSLATNKIAPVMTAGANTLDESNEYTGIMFASTKEGPWMIGIYGLEFTAWDEDALVFRTFKVKGWEDWRTIRVYIKTAPNVTKCSFGMIQYMIGELYADNFSLTRIPGNVDPRPALPRSGTLEFISYQGKDFFPIILGGVPPINEQGNAVTDLKRFKDAGFNTIGRIAYMGYAVSTYKKQFIDYDLAYIPGLTAVANERWKNDPGKQIAYTGWQSAKKTIDAWAGFSHVIGFEIQDELNANGLKSGIALPDVRMIDNICAYIKNKDPRALAHIEFHPQVYTKNSRDFSYYFRSIDSALFTQNVFPSYPVPERNAIRISLDKVGEYIRHAKALSPDKQFWAFGLGVYWWSNWDNRPSLPNGLSDWHFNEYIPFNLQRFQIWDQIINGATGVEFWGTSWIKLNDQYSKHHWDQITVISQELKELNGVLLEKVFYDEWHCDNPHIDAMLKNYDNKIYLFTASTHYEDIDKVTFSFPRQIKNIVALQENDDHDILPGAQRSIAVDGTGMGFTDAFKQQRCIAYAGQDPSAPGYAVHIYQFEEGSSFPEELAPEDDNQLPQKSALKIYNNILTRAGNTEARIHYELSDEADAHIDIYNAGGRLVKKFRPGKQPAGHYNVLWKGTDEAGAAVGSGIYLVHIKAGHFKDTKKIVVVK
jgi:hypothetical protein